MEKIRYNKNKDLPKILPADCKKTADSLPTQIRLDKIREDNIPPVSKDTSPQGEQRFKKPTIEEVKDYVFKSGYSIDPQSFVDFYESKGWKVGKSPMKDWKAAVRNWERSSFQRKQVQGKTKSEEIFEHNFNHLQALFKGE